MKELPTEHLFINPTVKRMVDGQLCIQFDGMFRSLLGMLFGLRLTPGTTREEAEALATELRKRCSHLFMAHLEHGGLSEAELDALTEMYDDLGLLDPDPFLDALEGPPVSGR